MQQGHDITTIEGLGTPKNLHPMHAAFVASGAPVRSAACSRCVPAAASSIPRPRAAR
jgi:xanthine dehydrogenase YagT iron-sulfur-binding subunit